jgi:prepilin-type N-terminal cleavage/methylation domain-containing protein
MKIKPALNKFFSKGFTLIELLIVIAILGILGGGIVVAIDPISKINSANLAKAETFAASLQNSLAIDIVGEWTFNDGTAKDTSGYGNNGIVNGATLTTDRKGEANKAYSFDGVDDYVDAGNDASLASSLFSIEFWLKKNNTVGLQTPLGKRSGTTGGWYFDNPTGSPIIRFAMGNGAIMLDVVTTSTAWPLVWGHIVTTWDGTTARIYLNGVQIGSGTLSSGSYTPGTGKLFIGALGPSTLNFFNGTIDEARVYNQALLSYQVQQLYAQGLKKHQLALK